MIFLFNLLLFALTLTAAEPDWGKIIDQQRNPHHDDHHEHHTNTPEPAAWVLIGVGLLAVAARRSTISKSA